MSRGGKRVGAGRPKANRKVVEVGFTEEELARCDALRGSKARGVWLGKLILSQPLSPFQKFSVLRKTP